MWTAAEESLLDDLQGKINNGYYEEAVQSANKFLEKIDDPSKEAYVRSKLGGALRLLKKDDQARTEFEAALQLADDDRVLHARILVDFASMFNEQEAIDMHAKALGWLIAGRVVFAERTFSLEAYKLYVQASLAYRLRTRESHEARRIVEYRRKLRPLARIHQRYKQAYLLTLRWEWLIRKRPLSLLRYIAEVIRQKRPRQILQLARAKVSR